MLSLGIWCKSPLHLLVEQQMYQRSADGGSVNWPHPARRDKLQALLKAFWLGEFEKLGPGGTVGSVLGEDKFTWHHANHSWIGQPFSPRQLLDNILCTIATLPYWGAWDEGEADQGGLKFLEQHTKRHLSDRQYSNALQNLSSCPFERYDETGKQYLSNLALLSDAAKIWFDRPGRGLTKAIKILIKRGIPQSNAATQVSWHKRDQEIEKWYRDRVKSWTGRQPTRDQDVEGAKAIFGDNLPRKVIWDLRERFAPHWSKPGRPRSSRKSGNK
jgi:hypothetical protein